MSTIPIEISTVQLLQAVERLPANELDAFVTRVNALRARQGSPCLSQDETTLLVAINRSHLLPEQQARFDALVRKRQDETISSDELRELLQMTDAIEQRDGERLQALIDLARLRGTTVPALMDALGVADSQYPIADTQP